MKLPLALLSFVIAAQLHAGEVRFYLGCYTKKGAGQGINTGTFDTETGRFGEIRLAALASNPGFVAVAPSGKFVYAAMELDGGAVGAFAVQPDGSLQALNTQPSDGIATCHVWLDSKGRHLFSADYTSGTIACFPIKPDGSLGEKTAFIKLEGSGPNPKRQTSPHAHAIYCSSDDKFVYVCDLGTDKVWSYRFDLDKGTLTPTDPPAGIVPPGGGPRHLALHPNGRFAYTNNEMGMSVTAFARDPEKGTLTAFQTLSTLPEGFSMEKVSTAEIFIHPTGKWLYVSNRRADTIAVYSVAEDGRLTYIQDAPAGVKIPRGMGIDPTGQWLITGGQDDNRLAALKIDQSTGKLSLSENTAEAPAPVCVEFVKP